jgi:hypothetical protein
MAYIENGTARLVSRKENAHKSFPGLTTGRPTIRRTVGPERFIYSFPLRPFTIFTINSGVLFCQRCRDGQADSGRRPRNQSSLVQHTKCDTRGSGISFVRVRTLHRLGESVDHINP